MKFFKVQESSYAPTTESGNDSQSGIEGKWSSATLGYAVTRNDILVTRPNRYEIDRTSIRSQHGLARREAISATNHPKQKNFTYPEDAIPSPIAGRLGILPWHIQKLCHSKS